MTRVTQFNTTGTVYTTNDEPVSPGAQRQLVSREVFVRDDGVLCARPARPGADDYPTRGGWGVHFDLAYDGGGNGVWTQYYRTRLGARLSRFWHRSIVSHGGNAVLFEIEDPR